MTQVPGPPCENESPPTPLAPTVSETNAARASDGALTELGDLLRKLEYDSDGPTAQPVIDPITDNLLVKKRLGIAASLFVALQSRHAAAGSHSLRISLTCSAWCGAKRLADEQRDRIEVAALLHDVGMIGVPDRILLKAGKLTEDESLVIMQGRRLSQEILSASCIDEEIIDTVANLSRWYDNSRPADAPAGEQAPLGSRMIAIAEAYDSMTTDHVYRPAMSQERAVAELYRCAGAQFDPQLVDEFAELLKSGLPHLQRNQSRAWLRGLDANQGDNYWQYRPLRSAADDDDPQALFRDKFLENMCDAVVFVDLAERVSGWNDGAEKLTGIPAVSVQQQNWTPKLLNMQDVDGVAVDDMSCPLHHAAVSGSRSRGRYSIRGRDGRRVDVDVDVMPITDRLGATRGAAMLLHDVSPETRLEVRCEELREEVTLDALTRLANRAELSRVSTQLVEQFDRQGTPCCLIICDLDHFKNVNDTYGHQAGDDVIVCMAQLLKAACRGGDLAARYGGEEFVLVCADSRIADAARRAEKIRTELERIDQVQMGGRNATACFGVTQVQSGDTAETILRRADRALLMAKDSGRNRVIQLGSGSEQEEPKTRRKGWWWWRLKTFSDETLLEENLVTPGPFRLSIEKLRGFVADHQAEVIKVDSDTVELEVECSKKRFAEGDAPPGAFFVSLRFSQEKQERSEPQSPLPTRTRQILVYVKIAARDTAKDTAKDRAKATQQRGLKTDQARHLLRSLRSYLMASPEINPLAGGEEESPGVDLSWKL